jgi:hypothetical protein
LARGEKGNGPARSTADAKHEAARGGPSREQRGEGAGVNSRELGGAGVFVRECSSSKTENVEVAASEGDDEAVADYVREVDTLKDNGQ